MTATDDTVFLILLAKVSPRSEDWLSANRSLMAFVLRGHDREYPDKSHKRPNVRNIATRFPMFVSTRPDCCEPWCLVSTADSPG